MVSIPIPAPLLYLLPSTLPSYLKPHGPSQSQNSWTLITGASDGIGLGIAHELATAGFNLILHGRNPSKLSRVSSELHATYPDLQIRTLISDASSFNPSDLATLVQPLVEDIPLTILVNNVGGTSPLHGRDFKPFTTHTASEIDALLSLNAAFTLHLTSLLLPYLHRSPRSLVLIIGSQACLGVPFLPVYSGTKALVHAWSRALRAEQGYLKSGTEVLEILVASVQSQQNKRETTGFWVPSSRVMAKAALARVGCGVGSVMGYTPHWLQWMGYMMLPRWCLDWAAVWTLTDLVEGRQKTW